MFPPVTAAFTVDASRVAEGGVVTATVTVTTDVPQQPHGDVGTLRVETEQGSAQAEDFEISRNGIVGNSVRATDESWNHPVGPSWFPVVEQAMQPVLENGLITEYMYQISVPFLVADDERPEADETFNILVEWEEWTGSGTRSLALDQDINTHVITIPEHDDTPQPAQPVSHVTVGSLGFRLHRVYLRHHVARHRKPAR